MSLFSVPYDARLGDLTEIPIAYGKALAKPHLPVVNVGTRENPTYLPPEVCLVLPGQSADAKLDPGQTQQMIRFAVRKPGANAESIVNEGLSIVGLKGNNVLLVLSLSIGDQRKR